MFSIIVSILCKVFHSRIDIGRLHLRYHYSYGRYGDNGWQRIVFYTKVPKAGTFATEHMVWGTVAGIAFPSLKHLIWKLSR